MTGFTDFAEMTTAAFGVGGLFAACYVSYKARTQTETVRVLAEERDAFKEQSDRLKAQLQEIKDELRALRAENQMLRREILMFTINRGANADSE
ncbi:hypothetical protein [Kitasatospora sp. NPDC056184]|uniref:hypothetical protein n=1 Tax=Kitasatospora sp. NPDC056184 TaxID=3345738 RepID=UPI0035DF82D4